MTKTQIEFVLAANDISYGIWLQLDKHIPLIILSQENNIFPNKNAVYRFNHEQELLEIVFGSYINKVFVTDSGVTDSSKFIPDHFISYKNIAGLSETISYLPGGGYYTIPFTNK